MRHFCTMLVVAAIVLAVSAAWASDDPAAGLCRCQASHLLGSSCSVAGPCPCTCSCPIIGSCRCVCDGYQIDRPPAG